MKEQNSAGLHWISHNPEDLSEEVSVTVLLSETLAAYIGTSWFHTPRADLCCWSAGSGSLTQMRWRVVVSGLAWCIWPHWCWVFAMLFLDCRGAFELCVPVRNWSELQADRCFFFWETVTSLRGSVLPDQKAVRAEVGKLKFWVKMWLHLSAIFSTVENRHMWKLSQLWEQTISLSWVVRAITPLPQLFLLFSELSLVFHLWMKRDLAYLEKRNSETLSSKTLWNYFVEAFVLSLQKKWVSSAAVHLESLQIRVILQRH